MKDTYRQWLDVRSKWREQEGDSLKPSDELASELRASYIAMLRLVAKGKKHLPGDMASELADAIEALSEGQDETFLIPGNLKLRQRKQPRAHPFLEKCRLDAVHYLHLVSSGELSDTHPVTTVARAYGVSQSTVHRWRNKYGHTQVSPPNPTLVKKLLRSSGQQYQKQIKRLTPKA